MDRIHILTHEFRPKRGGAGAVCEQIAETLSRMGREVTVWAPEYTSQATGFDPSYDVRVLRRLKGTRNLSCLLVMAREVAASRKTLRSADVYLGEPGPVAVFMVLTLLFPRFWKRLVITLHGSELVRYRKSRWWGAPLFRRLARKADAVHVLSRYNEQVLLDWLPELEGKLIRGFGMSLPGESLPEPGPTVPAAPAGKVRLLCVARIHPRKGQRELLEAVARLAPDARKQLHICFVGQLVKDRYYRDLRELADGCGAKVTFTGGLSDAELEAQYEAADLFALTSVPFGTSVEGLGLVYLEASRYGLPILAHRIGGVEEVVKHGQNGYLCEPSDRGELMRNLDILIRNPLVRRQLGEQGRAMVRAHNWQSVVSRLFPER